VPDANPNYYWRKDIAGAFLNTRGLPINLDTPEILHAKSTAGKKKMISVKVPPNTLPLWDNYHFQLKFIMKEGNCSVRWRVNGEEYLFINLSSRRDKGIYVGSFVSGFSTEEAEQINGLIRCQYH